MLTHRSSLSCDTIRHSPAQSSSLLELGLAPGLLAWTTDLRGGRLMDIVMDEIVPPAAPQFRVLLVDDDQFVHEMMGLFLGKTEYSLVSATNAHDAIKIIDSDPPDILITDAMMPGESGFSLIEKMKA